MSKEIYTTACGGCAEKLGQVYDLAEVEDSDKRAYCPWCQQMLWVRKYQNFGPRRPLYKPARSGGGERALAGRR